MSMPKISDINPNINIRREDALNIIIASIAMEELAMAHILNAEGEKLQYVLGTLEGKDPGEITICDIMEINKSIHKTLRDVIKAEMLLQFKLEDVLELAELETEPCETTITGNKVWRDGNNVAGIRPPFVKIKLLRDGADYKSAIVNSRGDGRYTFACLPLKNIDGIKYTYTVDEEEVPQGYTKTIVGYNVINTIQQRTITIPCSKKWVDNNNASNKRPPEITVALLQNGNEIDTEDVPSPTTGDTATFSFTDVPQFDNEGTPYVYTLDEDVLADYNTSIAGFNITNTLKTITP